MAYTLTREMVAHAVGLSAGEDAPDWSEAVLDEEHWSLAEVAAVTAYFAPDRLRHLVPDTASQPGALPALLGAAVVVRDEKGCPRWMLRDEVRREALRRLARAGRLRPMLDRQDVTDDDVLQEMLHSCLRGEVPPLQRQSLPELRAFARVMGWLNGILPLDVDAGALRRRIALAALLQPFHHLTGKHFRGREAELKQLRRYVDVLPESSLLRRARQRIESIVRERFQRLEVPPLMVSGPGGMGKSSLIARFILMHAETHQPVRFVYIDFDRPGLSPERTETLLAEAAGQLALQPRAPNVRVWDFGGEPQVSDAATEWTALRTAALERAAQSRAMTLEERRTLLNRFRTLLDISGMADEPLLWVFDTFEEVQYRSNDFVTTVGGFIAELQRIAPRVRVVLAGRALVRDFDTQSLILGEFDREAAVGYLAAQGIADTDLAERVATRLGGTPLTLRLAAELLKAEPRGTETIRDWNVRSLGFLRAKESEIQAQLYRRILEHIHDPDVRRLAHPGLILRRITPELIQHVLAKACGVSVPGPLRALELFEELRREVSLVTDAPDGAVEHRGDVRRVMSNLLAADDPRGVRRIHMRAIAYYRQFGDPRSRAEEIYHRLALGQSSSTLDRRWLPEAAVFLENAFEDLPAGARAYLASHSGADGFIDPSVWRAADLSVWERHALHRASDLVAAGKRVQALEVVRERSERTFASPLYLIEATLLESAARKDEALEIAGRAIEQLSAVNDRKGLLPFLILYGRISGAMGATYNAQNALLSARHIARSTSNRIGELEATFERAKLRWELNLVRPYVPLQELSVAFRSLSDREIREAPDLARRAAAELGENAVMRRVVHLVGLPATSSFALDALAAELAAFEGRRLAAGSGGETEWFRRETEGAPFGNRGRAWRWLIRRAGSQQLAELVVRLFDGPGPDGLLMQPLQSLLGGEFKSPSKLSAARVLFVVASAGERIAENYVDALLSAGMNVIEAYERDDILRRVTEDGPDVLVLDGANKAGGSESFDRWIIEQAHLRRLDDPLQVLTLEPRADREKRSLLRGRRTATEAGRELWWGMDPTTLVIEVGRLVAEARNKR